jgi:hypothetical protein
VSTKALALGPGRLGDTAPSGQTLQVSGRALAGLGKIEWCPFAPSELPAEQGPDDAASVIFDAPPATQPMEILGSPVARLRLAASGAHGQVAARLCEVTAEGRSWLVAWGVLDLTRREGLDRFDPLEPGRMYDVEVPLGFVAHRLRPGARWRLAVSAGLWPLVWPSPEPADLTLHLAGCRLDLPVRTAPGEEAAMPIPLAAPPPDDPAASPVFEVTRAPGAVTVAETWPAGPAGSGPDVRLAMTVGDAASCSWRAEQTSAYHWPQGVAGLKATVAVSASATAFHVEEETIATLDGAVVAHIRQVNDVPRRA